jgi:hypothetical protein
MENVKERGKFGRSTHIWEGILNWIRRITCQGVEGIELEQDRGPVAVSCECCNKLPVSVKYH